MGMSLKMDWKGHPEIYYLWARQNGSHRKTDEGWKVPVRVRFSFSKGSETLDSFGDYIYECESDEDITYPRIYEWLHSLPDFEGAKADL